MDELIEHELIEKIREVKELEEEIVRNAELKHTIPNYNKIRIKKKNDEEMYLILVISAYNRLRGLRLIKHIPLYVYSEEFYEKIMEEDSYTQVLKDSIVEDIKTITDSIPERDTSIFTLIRKACRHLKGLINNSKERFIFFKEFNSSLQQIITLEQKSLINTLEVENTNAQTTRNYYDILRDLCDKKKTKKMISNTTKLIEIAEKLKLLQEKDTQYETIIHDSKNFDKMFIEASGMPGHWIGATAVMKGDIQPYEKHDIVFFLEQCELVHNRAKDYGFEYTHLRFYLSGLLFLIHYVIKVDNRKRVLELLIDFKETFCSLLTKEEHEKNQSMKDFLKNELNPIRHGAENEPASEPQTERIPERGMSYLHEDCNFYRLDFQETGEKELTISLRYTRLGLFMTLISEIPHDLVHLGDGNKLTEDEYKEIAKLVLNAYQSEMDPANFFGIKSLAGSYSLKEDAASYLIQVINEIKGVPYVSTSFETQSISVGEFDEYKIGAPKQFLLGTPMFNVVSRDSDSTFKLVLQRERQNITACTEIDAGSGGKVTYDGPNIQNADDSLDPNKAFMERYSKVMLNVYLPTKFIEDYEPDVKQPDTENNLLDEFRSELPARPPRSETFMAHVKTFSGFEDLNLVKKERHGNGFQYTGGDYDDAPDICVMLTKDIGEESYSKTLSFPNYDMRVYPLPSGIDRNYTLKIYREYLEQPSMDATNISQDLAILFTKSIGDVMYPLTSHLYEFMQERMYEGLPRSSSHFFTSNPDNPRVIQNLKDRLLNQSGDYIMIAAPLFLVTHNNEPYKGRYFSCANAFCSMNDSELTTRTPVTVPINETSILLLRLICSMYSSMEVHDEQIKSQIMRGIFETSDQCDTTYYRKIIEKIEDSQFQYYTDERESTFLPTFSEIPLNVQRLLSSTRDGMKYETFFRLMYALLSNTDILERGLSLNLSHYDFTPYVNQVQKEHLNLFKKQLESMQPINLSNLNNLLSAGPEQQGNEQENGAALRNLSTREKEQVDNLSGDEEEVIHGMEIGTASITEGGVNGEQQNHTPNTKRPRLEPKSNGGGVKKNKNSQKRRKPKFIMKHAQQRKTIKKR